MWGISCLTLSAVQSEGKQWLIILSVFGWFSCPMSVSWPTINTINAWATVSKQLQKQADSNCCHKQVCWRNGRNHFDLANHLTRPTSTSTQVGRCTGPLILQGVPRIWLPWHFFVQIPCDYKTIYGASERAFFNVFKWISHHQRPQDLQRIACQEMFRLIALKGNKLPVLGKDKQPSPCNSLSPSFHFQLESVWGMRAITKPSNWAGISHNM